MEAHILKDLGLALTTIQTMFVTTTKAAAYKSQLKRLSRNVLSPFEES